MFSGEINSLKFSQYCKWTLEVILYDRYQIPVPSQQNSNLPSELCRKRNYEDLRSRKNISLRNSKIH